MSRIFTQLNNDKAKWNMAMTLFLTTRGIPQVFYGTEILMGNEGTEDHGIIRSDFPGGWPSDSEKNAFSGKGLSGDELWAQERIKTLLALRQTHPQLFKGELKHYAPVDGVYTYFRVAEDTAQKLMVILNKKPVDLPLAKYAEVLGTDVSITRVSDGQTFNVSETISLPAMSANVFLVQ
jgi:glycosidase